MNKQELIALYERVGNFVEAVKVKDVIDKLKQLDEPQKVTVPQFVADYIKDAKYYEWDLDDVFDHIAEESGESEIFKWFYTLGNIDVFVRAWLDGYEVEKEKRYLVKIRGFVECGDYFNYFVEAGHWAFSGPSNHPNVRTYHTRKELEEAGFGEVFHSPMFEVEEVE